ncbi:MAG: hypothetical protein LBS03_08080 [Bacteroidales bacterium]|jgi:hypothetical protein|nr:hypothetical protein [Bacteroidales bacterium]
MNVFYHIRELLVHPHEHWITVATEKKSRNRIFREFVVPLLCMVAICTLLGAVLFASRFDLSVAFVLRKISLLLCTLSTGLYLSSYLINALIPITVRNLQGIFALLAYSSGITCLLIAVVELFPFPYLKEMIVLAFYSVYLYWRGITEVLNIAESKRNGFLMLSFITVAAVYLFLFFFFGKILEALLP